MTEVRYYEGIGRRKRATARVRLYESAPGDAIDGANRVTVNDKPLDQYFGRFQDRQQAIEPLKLTHNEGR
jgi:small subunit ribosomal protein S9